ncbi:MAG: ABC transporter permease [Chloroflexi bacterium SZAS-1]|jgi:ABC-type transport system involved in multi-copper enzyme maturation permease subunit|nr:ABC transporter permease [Chloroflexi bacterium SZAS-1]HNP87867.1 ABC transporter permease [Kouleothrix sp.]
MAEFNPVLVKELRSRMRGARAFVLLTVYLLILSGVALLFYTAIADISATDLNSGRTIGKSMFFLIGAVALVEVCIITPALTAGSIAGEKERQSYDLLIASLLSPWQIVWGKLAAALSFALLLILAIVPLMSLAFLFGGVSLTEVLIALAGLVTTALFYASIGVFWSAAMRTTLGANSLALGTVILMLLGIPFIAVMFSLIFGREVSPEWINSATFKLASGVFLYLHPFIALQASEMQILSGDSAFYTRVPLGPDVSGGSLFVPSPWLVYVLLALLCSAVLIVVTMRMLRPVQDGPRRVRASDLRDTKSTS